MLSTDSLSVNKVSKFQVSSSKEHFETRDLIIEREREREREREIMYVARGVPFQLPAVL